MYGTVLDARENRRVLAGTATIISNQDSVGSPLLATGSATRRADRLDHEVAHIQEKLVCLQKQTLQQGFEGVTCTQALLRRQVQSRTHLRSLQSFPRTNLLYLSQPPRTAKGPVAAMPKHLILTRTASRLR